MLDKENAAARTGIFMIDASKGFMKDGNKNRLRHQDIHKIVDVFNKQIELPKYSRMVPLAEIASQRLTTSTSPATSTAPNRKTCRTSRPTCWAASRTGTSTTWPAYWELFPGLKGRLFAANSRPGYSELKVPAGEIKPTIFGRSRVRRLHGAGHAVFLPVGRRTIRPRLKGLAVGCRPKQLIEELSEDLLKAFADVWLLDKYDRLPAPDDLLDRDHAGRCLPDRGGRLAGERAT